MDELENLITNIRCRASRAARLGEAVRVDLFDEMDQAMNSLIKLDKKVTARLAAAEQHALARL
jgi:hypothetical protein